MKNMTLKEADAFEAKIIAEENAREKREEAAGMYSKQYMRELKGAFKGSKVNGQIIK